MSDKKQDKAPTTLIHPATQGILNLTSYTEKHLLEENYPKAFETMTYMINRMAPGDKNINYETGNTITPLKEILTQEEKYYRTTRSIQRKRRREQRHRYEYREWLAAIMEQLHKRGYLDGSKFQNFHDPAAGRKSQ